MSSDLDFVQFAVENLDASLNVSFRKMFGEFAIYADGKVVALICNNQFFVKPTEAGKNFIGEVQEVPPYNGAKNYFLIENVENKAFLSELLKITSENLPAKKVRKK